MQEITEQEQIIRLLKGVQWDRRQHGSLYDRGSSDSYYRRAAEAHYYIHGATSRRITDLTDEEQQEYLQGYFDNQAAGNFKDWN